MGLLEKVYRYFFKLLPALTVTLWLVPGIRIQAHPLQGNSNIGWSPDHKAFTTDAGEKDYKAWPRGTVVSTGAKSGLEKLRTGQHYFAAEKSGYIPVKKWEVKYTPGQCIHNSYGIAPGWHGISFHKGNCGGYYKSGWVAVCADCGEQIDILFYMDRETAQSISALPVGTDYYYLCPRCDNLEQGRCITHICKKISWNRYTVKYEKNNRKASGYMEESVFFYNNSGNYEGMPVKGEERLRKNTYQMIGYVFDGWNTKADGTGTAFKDEQQVWNLTAENKGIIVLYAQWKACRSTLMIHPGGGTYMGSGKVTAIAQEYGTFYEPRQSLLKAPKGYTVSFDSRGGRKAADQTAPRSFQSWQIKEPLQGRFLEDIYYFLGEDGAVDMITAIYAAESITLPGTARTGWSFGGWFEDSACTRPVGMEGDSYTPTKNITLYAKWVQLVLEAEPNYRQNEKKGAIDLFWSQPDGTEKTYLLYQSTDCKTYTQIKGVSGEENIPLMNKNYSFTGSAQKVEIPSGGFYELTASGAQGGSYKERTGGKGGMASARIYLEKGDVLTVKVGGQNRYNGGGKGKVYGNGGGATTIVSQKKGLLIAAGGGGGASPAGNGGAGGKDTSLNASGEAKGESGYSGGGGGYIGGRAGEYITHSHDKDCYQENDIVCDVLAEGAGTYSCSISNMHSVDQTIQPDAGDFRIGGHNGGKEGNICSSVFYIGNLTAAGYNSISFMLEMCAEGGNAGAMGQEKTDQYLQITDQKGTVIWYADRTDLEVIPYSSTSDPEYGDRRDDYQKADSCVGWTHKNAETTAVTQYVKFVGKAAIPEGTTAIYIKSELRTNNKVYHYQSQTWKSLVISGAEKTKICPYEEGQILSAKPAYGGSSYVAECAVECDMKSGKRTGNGSAEIKAVSVGYQDEQELKGIAAPDRERPNKVAEDTLEEKTVAGGRVQFRWKEPEDKGTIYYHKAESYRKSDGTKLCVSNTTKTEIRTGVAGYYYLLNYKAAAEPTAKQGNYIKSRTLTITPVQGEQYLHLAPVDGAGNIGPAIHIPCGLKNIGHLWKPQTRQLEIGSVVAGVEYGSVCPKDEKHYYVKADGQTPFLFSFAAQLEGEARKDYQINKVLLVNQAEGKEQRFIAQVPYGGIGLENQEIPGESISVQLTSPEPLGLAAAGGAKRFQGSKEITCSQGFTLDRTWNGKMIEVIPVAGADHEKGVQYSDWKEDVKHGLCIIGDGEAPVISGAEDLENIMVIKRGEGEEADKELILTAVDYLSGVQSFEVVLQNAADFSEVRYTPQEDGSIRINLSEDSPLLAGDFKITIRARDRVGNENCLEYFITEFGLQAEVERILEPHAPVFKCGESGILHIRAWGYVERIEVEFPPEMTALNPQLNHCYEYENPQWRQEEKLQFMVPLYTPPDGDYKITVRAYKGNSCIEKYPSLCTISVTDSVLDEIRTRLR